MKQSLIPLVVSMPDITPASKGWGQEVFDFREKAVAASPVEDEDDTLSYFAKLAEED